MKKLAGLVFGLVVLASFSMTSCKKECTCTQKVDGAVVSTYTQEVKGKCSDMDITSTTLGVTQTVTCE